MVANALANRGAVLLKVAAIPASGASFSGQASRAKQQSALRAARLVHRSSVQLLGAEAKGRSC